MTDYKMMYFQLAAKVADAVDLLVTAQQDAENSYLDASNNEDNSTAPQEGVTMDNA